MKIIYTCLFTAMVFIGLTSLSSCNRYECESSTTAIDLTPFSLSKVPYSGFDTLIFLNKQGDTCIVTGSGKQYYYITTPLSDNNPSCEPNYEKKQGYSISYSPLQGELSFKLKLEGAFDLIIDKENYAYRYEYSTNEIGVVGTDDDDLYIDTMTINGKLFNTIRRARIRKKVDPLQSNNNYQAYYNKEYGLLKLENLELNEEYSIILK